MFQTRQIEESLIYCLALNSIFANAEQGTIVAAATSEQALRDFYESQKLDAPEIINGYRYTFREGALRNCNPLDEWHHIDQNLMGWNQGWFDQWVQDPYASPDGCVTVDF